jgi:hypothetical protein
VPLDDGKGQKFQLFSGWGEAMLPFELLAPATTAQSEEPPNTPVTAIDNLVKNAHDERR